MRISVPVQKRRFCFAALPGVTSRIATGLLAGVIAFSGTLPLLAQEDTESISAEELELIRKVENQRIKVIEQVVGSVIAIYGPSRQGGGSGVIIDPSGIALTNHHVIEGAGMKGFGGLDDGELYEWDLIGTDPGGDVAIIKMKGKDEFPWSPLGDSDKVKVGDWALAMGNPFLLAHDQSPTVTLGIVSGVERFQEGMGAQLVYGNCIQIDSSINPGNSGGPLFNMNGEVIGINGRGSFRDRGRVNVGLGYAISSNQIKNFLPDLLATKIVEHGTLDAAFSNRGGKVVCSTIDLDSPAARAGLELGDELLEFEGRAISYANQFKNLICTYPEDWPASLRIRKEDGREMAINVRMFGLPYNFQPDEEETPEEDEDDDKDDAPGDEGEPEGEEDGKDQEPDEGDNDQEGNEESKDDEESKGEEEGEPEDGRRPRRPRRGDRPQRPADNAELKKYLLNEPGVVVNYEINASSVEYVLGKWRRDVVLSEPAIKVLKVVDEIRDGEDVIGQQTIHVAADGRFHVTHQVSGEKSRTYLFDGEKFWKHAEAGPVEMDLVEAKIEPVITQAMALVAPLQENPFEVFGKTILDGGDKAQGVVTSRMMWLDEDDDWFYGWLSLYDDAGSEQVYLLKVASDRDCPENAPGITLADYRETEGVMIPWEKNLVHGLDEQVQWTAVTRSIDPVELDEALFVASKDASQ